MFPGLQSFFTIHLIFKPKYITCECNVNHHAHQHQHQHQHQYSSQDIAAPKTPPDQIQPGISAPELSTTAEHNINALCDDAINPSPPPSSKVTFLIPPVSILPPSQQSSRSTSPVSSQTLSSEAIDGYVDVLATPVASSRLTPRPDTSHSTSSNSQPINSNSDIAGGFFDGRNTGTRNQCSCQYRPNRSDGNIGTPGTRKSETFLSRWSRLTVTQQNPNIQQHRNNRARRSWTCGVEFGFSWNNWKKSPGRKSSAGGNDKKKRNGSGRRDADNMNDGREVVGVGVEST